MLKRSHAARSFMAKATVERYEQVLAQDPTSAAFVELADALIQNNEYQRAAEVCGQGIGHHPDSVVGRVLWGKALLNLGRAAEAMEQFEQATAIDRQNPRPFILVSEVLLQRGLYRSALPLLRKAAALQPGDEHIRQWLEETQRALARGPGTSGSFTPPPMMQQPSTPKPSQPAATPVFDTNEAALLSLGPAAARAPADSNEAALPSIEPAALQGIETTSPFAQPLAEPAAPENTRPELPFIQPEDGELSISGRRRLLEDVPEHPEPTPIVPQAEHQVTLHAAEEIAKQYESHLREQLKQKEKAARKSFLGRHWPKVAVGVVVGGALIVGVVGFMRIRAEHRGQNLRDVLSVAKKAIAQDTRRAYAAALLNLSRALEMDDECDEAWALAAYTHALLFADSGASPSSRAKAEAALSHPRVRTKFPGLALATDYYLANAAQREPLVRAILASSSEEPEVQELAGRILLSQNDSKGALARFGRVFKVSPGNVRALVAVGDYYRTSGDYASALKFYAGPAAQLSPDHPGRVVGAAEARLELGVDLEEALGEVSKLPPADELPMGLVARRELAQGKLLAAVGQHAKAVEKLSAGVRIFPSYAFEFNLALGDANRAAGQMEATQHAFEAALKLGPKSDEAIEALGRALIARDREREALSRFPSDPQSRKVSLIRGMAFAKLREWKRARAELANTQLNGKLPVEAAVHLALADAAEGHADRAQAALEKTLAASHKAKGEIRVALGQVYWQRGALDRAKAQFEDAAKEADDYEGNCSLGRLLISLGSEDAAMPALEKALARNASHGEARHALGRVYVDQGKLGDAVKQFEAWQADNPNSALPEKDLGWALYHTGKLKEAEAALARALRADPKDVEGHRVHAMVLYARGSPKAGLAELHRANKLNPKDADTFCEIGRAFVRQGNRESGLKAYEAALREDPGSSCAKIGPYYAGLPAGSRAAAKELEEITKRIHATWLKAFGQATQARVLLGAGAVKDARRMAEQAVVLAPFSGDAHLALGLVFARQKEDAQARDEFARAVELEPADGSTRLAFADFLGRGEGTAQQAIDQYRAFLRLGGNSKDEARVKRLLPNLKKKLASR